MAASTIEKNIIKPKDKDSLSVELRKEVETDYFVDEIVDGAWPLTLLILVTCLYFPIKRVLNSIANSIEKAKEITINGISWKTSELEQAVIDLEILKGHILMATIDNDYDPNEIQLIENRAREMKGHINQLTDEGKKVVLLELINMAAVDNKFVAQEYVLLRAKSEELNIQISDLDKMILTECVTRTISPPPALQEQFIQRQRQLGLSVAA